MLFLLSPRARGEERRRYKNLGDSEVTGFEKCREPRTLLIGTLCAQAKRTR
jgi:hypothetical protein